jgi:hypothetical protein
MSPFTSTLIGSSFTISGKINKWKHELSDDYDRDYLLEGLANGFKITDLIEADKITGCEMKNHKSVSELHNDVEKQLLDGIKNGHYIIANCKPTIVSPLAAIPKNDAVVFD